MIELKLASRFARAIRTAAPSTIARRVAASAICGAFGLFVLASPLHADTRTTPMNNAQTTHSSANDAIRPFTFNFTDEALTVMRRRILATRWPEKETVSDTSQGVP